MILAMMIAVMLMAASPAMAGKKGKKGKKPKFIDCANQTPNSEQCNGTQKSDRLIRGTDNRDVIDALGGNDLVRALGGDDEVEGDDGNDDLRGNEGDDKVSGEAGNDQLRGGPGDDELNGNAGNDQIFDKAADGDGSADKDTANGGSGNDRIDVADGDGDDVVDCGEETDATVVDNDTVIFDPPGTDENGAATPGDQINVNCENQQPKTETPAALEAAAKDEE